MRIQLHTGFTRSYTHQFIFADCVCTEKLECLLLHVNEPPIKKLVCAKSGDA